jgi:hypothetical protein
MILLPREGRAYHHRFEADNSGYPDGVAGLLDNLWILCPTWISSSSIDALMPKVKVTYDTIRRLALALPNVEEGTSYGTPALKVKGKLFVRLHDDRDKIVLKMPFDRREEMMAEDPETYFITDHYRNYPWVLVSLAKVRVDALPDLLNIAYREASPTKKPRV